MPIKSDQLKTKKQGKLISVLEPRHANNSWTSHWLIRSFWMWDPQPQKHFLAQTKKTNKQILGP